VCKPQKNLKTVNYSIRTTIFEQYWQKEHILRNRNKKAIKAKLPLNLIAFINLAQFR
jgi:hypothetical protein